MKAQVRSHSLSHSRSHSQSQSHSEQCLEPGAGCQAAPTCLRLLATSFLARQASIAALLLLRLRQ